MERGRTLAARIMNPSLLKQQASERANSDAPSAEDASPTVLPIVGIALVVEGEPPGIILRRVVAQRDFESKFDAWSIFLFGGPTSSLLHSYRASDAGLACSNSTGSAACMGFSSW